MLSNDRKKIILMNPVRVDYALNKYNKKSTKEMDASGVSTISKKSRKICTHFQQACESQFKNSHVED